MSGSPPRRLPKTLAAGFFVAVLILLNLATVLPALHALAHDDHPCDQPDCVVVALAQGGLEPISTPQFSPPPLVAPLPAPAIPAGSPASAPADCPPLPGRAPPVA